MMNRGPVLLVTIAAALLATTSIRAQQAGRQEPAHKQVEQQDPDSHPLTRANLGIEFAVTTSKIRRSIIRTKTPYGFAVRAVTKDSLADTAGITKGTVVLEVDGQPLREVAELEAVLATAAPAQKLVLKCSDRKQKTSLLDRKPWVERKVEIVLPEDDEPDKNEKNDKNEKGDKQHGDQPRMIGEVHKG